MFLRSLFVCRASTKNFEASEQKAEKEWAHRFVRDTDAIATAYFGGIDEL